MNDTTPLAVMEEVFWFFYDNKAALLITDIFGLLGAAGQAVNFAITSLHKVFMVNMLADKCHLTHPTDAEQH